jgi:hypothetical protein
MDSLLVTQLVCAFAPAFIGLAIATVTSPRMFRLVAKVFQFDLTTAMLLMAAFAVLFAMNRAMREMEQLAWHEHLNEQAALRQEYNDPNYEFYPGGGYWAADFHIAMLTATSIFTVPGLIFARLLIDSYRDECRSRAGRKQRLLGTDLQAALTPQPEPVKPQWID